MQEPQYRLVKDYYGNWSPQSGFVMVNGAGDFWLEWKDINPHKVYTYVDAADCINQQKYNKNPVIVYPPFPDEEP